MRSTLPIRRNNQVTSASTVSNYPGLDGAAGLTYDYSGNLTGMNGRVLSWNSTGELTSVTNTSSGTVSFAYDAFGRRISKTVGSTTVFYLYSGSHLLAEIDSTGNLIRSYTWGALGLISDRSATTGLSRYYLYDGLGNTRTLVDGSGNTLDQTAYSAFGTSNDASPAPTMFGWKGRHGIQYDSETGLYLMGARYYTPALGRFLSRDPAGFVNGTNLYLYCGDDPINLFDPTGTFPTAAQISGWYMGGMGGTSDFIDRNLMNGSTSRFGNTAGRYDSGKASGAEVARDAAWFGANLVNNAFFLKDMGTLGIGLAKNGWKAAANALKQGGCFVAGTQVQVLADETASAKTSQKKHIKTKSNRVISKPIEKIQKGDVVASKNEKTGKIEWKHVDHTTIRTVDLTLTVHLADANTGKELEAITATREHPFYVEGKGFVPAGGLAIGNAIVTRAGPTLKVKQIEWHRRPEGYKVYNLVVEDDHTYFVGKVNGGVWVHNPGACSKVYEATLNPGAGGGVVAGRQLTRAEAVEAINRGKDVVADSRNLARSLAKTASGNSRPIGPEIHGNPIDGFMDHYHPDPRNGSHIFFP